MGTYTSSTLRRTAAPRSKKLRGLAATSATATKITSATPSGGGIGSVGLTVPTGFETEGSPLTANGSITLKYANGYSLPTVSKQQGWDGAVSAQHTHSNKALLDTYAQTEVNLADAVGKKHEHSNGSTLDGITAEKITAWDGAVEDEHAHSNKDVLDGVTSSLIADWNGAATDKHTHSNKALLDTYTQTEVNLADAVGKKHEHSNKSELDKIESGDVNSWNDAADALGGHSVGVDVPSDAKFTDTIYDDTELAQRVIDIGDDLDDKVDKVSGKDLSTNDFTTAYKTRLDGLTNVVKHDGTANAVQTIAVCSSYPAVLDDNTLYILI